jgi:hypothetical protein
VGVVCPDRSQQGVALRTAVNVAERFGAAVLLQRVAAVKAIYYQMYTYLTWKLQVAQKHF